MNAEKRAGIFACAGCGKTLFASDTTFESGTGWPSFFQPLAGAAGTTEDRSLFVTRTEVHCAECGGHLGHFFPGWTTSDRATLLYERHCYDV